MERIAERVESLLPTHRRVLVALAGGPGSGKTHCADLLRSLLADQLKVRVQVLSMDGFHLTRAQLDAMSDPALAHRRRGAPFTFDADAFVACVERIAAASADSVVLCPSFDHALKDPVADDVRIESDVRVVIVEGLYCLLDEAPWSALQAVWHATVWVECALETALERVVQRRIRAMGQSEADARDQVQANDRLNAEHVATRSRAAEFKIDNAAFVIE